MGTNMQEAVQSTRWGIEIEMTGITRTKAASVVAKFFNVTAGQAGRHLDERRITDPQGRTWKVVSDSSITAQKKQGGIRVSASELYKVELVSPILTYRADIETLQGLVRALRKAGAFTSANCGIHIHLDGADHTPRSIRNFINIVASKDDLLYDALRIPLERQRWCKKMSAKLVDEVAAKRPRTMGQIEEIWYGTCGMGCRTSHYHNSRYHFLNLHSFFQPGGNHTVELRGFNAGDANQRLHAGLIRSYVALALAMNSQALTQASASARPNQMENKRFAMRTWLVRMGLVGDEFANCREHLCKHLHGNSAFRYRVA